MKNVQLQYIGSHEILKYAYKMLRNMRRASWVMRRVLNEFVFVTCILSICILSE